MALAALGVAVEVVAERVEGEVEDARAAADAAMGRGRGEVDGVEVDVGE